MTRITDSIKAHVENETVHLKRLIFKEFFMSPRKSILMPFTFFMICSKGLFLEDTHYNNVFPDISGAANPKQDKTEGAMSITVG